MTHLLAFSIGVVFGTFGTFATACFVRKPERKAQPLTLVDPHQMDILLDAEVTDLAAWAESRGPRGVA